MRLWVVEKGWKAFLVLFLSWWWEGNRKEWRSCISTLWVLAQILTWRFTWLLHPLDRTQQRPKHVLTLGTRAGHVAWPSLVPVPLHIYVVLPKHHLSTWVPLWSLKHREDLGTENRAFLSGKLKAAAFPGGGERSQEKGVHSFKAISQGCWTCVKEWLRRESWWQWFKGHWVLTRIRPLLNGF